MLDQYQALDIYTHHFGKSTQVYKLYIFQSIYWKYRIVKIQVSMHHSTNSICLDIQHICHSDRLFYRKECKGLEKRRIYSWKGSILSNKMYSSHRLLSMSYIARQLVYKRCLKQRSILCCIIYMYCLQALCNKDRHFDLVKGC